MDEVWKPVPSWPAYSVSNLGRVRRNGGFRGRKERILSVDNNAPRRTAILSDGPLVKSILISRLVLLAFRGPSPEGKPFACHKDDNKKNDLLSNLYWGDRLDNGADAVRNGKYTEAGRNPSVEARAKRSASLVTYWATALDRKKRNTERGRARRKLTEDQIAEIRRRYVPFVVTYKMLAKEFGVSVELIRLRVAE